MSLLLQTNFALVCFVPVAPVIMSAHSSDNKAEESEHAGWEGSEVSSAEIEWLRRTRRIPEGFECRRPSGEIEPTPAAGERVVFVTHFERGFGLPASPFFRAFLNRFHLQPHHLPANAVTQLSALEIGRAHV